MMSIFNCPRWSGECRPRLYYFKAHPTPTAAASVKQKYSMAIFCSTQNPDDPRSRQQYYRVPYSIWIECGVVYCHSFQSHSEWHWSNTDKWFPLGEPVYLYRLILWMQLHRGVLSLFYDYQKPQKYQWQIIHFHLIKPAIPWMEKTKRPRGCLWSLSWWRQRTDYERGWRGSRWVCVSNSNNPRL